MDTTFRWKRRTALAALLATLCAATVPARAASAAPAAPEGRPTLVVLGDSLSAEYGLPRDTGWVALLRQRLATERIDYSVANASVSGDTTSGGRARLPAVLQRLKPSIVIVELGSNDALRGVPVATTEQNLRDIIAAARRAHAQVVLVGMYVPPNYGPDYTQKFHAVYTRLSKQLGVPLVPFLLAGIENKPEMFQSDQMHPGEQAQRVLLDNVWPTLKPLLGKPRG
ncbi:MULTISPECIES: arylesterase [Burkholderia]|jgi:acyl-CoA thioesterase-1|uniref:Arylesterase n=1 Tax=Burkholderia vietnamiensis TaxID=60552 RepID=A0A103FL51_BURVI|nr:MULTISPECIES: arylesterase [Burkholderia]TPQ46664.1 arylesterase [Burkholderia ubonensis]AFJ86081.1 Arylesterase precursor [Burkholderia sp. KJ006]AOJ13615.1 arylesterase [Burkholderia vietnamiensis]KKI36740.1 arylesterase [Burkholderia vietnamiensis]KVE29094.1 arylesterase [Burkholderia vietnamiensis]